MGRVIPYAGAIQWKRWPSETILRCTGSRPPITPFTSRSPPEGRTPMSWPKWERLQPSGWREQSQAPRAPLDLELDRSFDATDKANQLLQREAIEAIVSEVG